METIETVLRKYRMCRAEMERGCGVGCAGCPNNLSGSIMHLIALLDDKVGALP